MSLPSFRSFLCSIRYDEGEGKVYVVGGKGDTWRNGKPVREGAEVCLEIYDRVAMGDQVQYALSKGSHPLTQALHPPF